MGIPTAGYGNLIENGGQVSEDAPRLNPQNFESVLSHNCIAQGIVQFSAGMGVAIKFNNEMVLRTVEIGDPPKDDGLLAES